ncbi:MULTISPECIES: hypothetical protein [Streptomyces]|uniref:WXG100 family type VII secretion target n=1 Tax=Streptomyces viridochromogenes TaxID=1938 RepID=A0A0L8JD83_STRVR|nr:MULTISPECIES: hypothetical protein [Streptomyces]KOG11610.1 hypothetical protein ADK34_33925 [Streptomyces viridochromogenes]
MTTPNNPVDAAFDSLFGPLFEMGQAYAYAIEPILDGLDELGKVTDVVENSVATMKANVELNFDGWAGASKAEFTRVHQETAAHLVAISDWLLEMKQKVGVLVQGVSDDDNATAQRLSQ